MIVALDVYRPAAIDQLNQLAQKINVPCYKEDSKDVIAIAKNGLAKAEQAGNNVILFDTNHKKLFLLLMLWLVKTLLMSLRNFIML